MLTIEQKRFTIEYLEKVGNEWENFRGTKIPLSNVYVMLQAMENRPPKPSGTYQNVTQKAQQRGSLAPERVASGKSGSLDGIDLKPEPSPPMPLSKILSEAHHLALLGEPGTGKSTTLQFIGLCFAREGWARKWFEIDEPLVPILLVLREHPEILSGSGLCLEKALAQAVNKRLRLTEAEAESLVAAWQDDDRLLVLLDGLDEVPDHLRSNVAKEIGLYAGSENGEKCRIVLTSRPSGYSSHGDLSEYILKPFQRPEDALPFLKKWLATVQPGWSKQQVVDESGKLFAEITGHPVLRRYVDNPLLLRMAVETYASHGVLANNRGKMYGDYVSETAWASDEVLRSTTPAQRGAALDAMEDLAWQLLPEKVVAAPLNQQLLPKKVIADPPNLSLLRDKLRLVELEAGKFKFSHQTFQEYFVARRLVKAWQEKGSRKRAWIMLRPRLHDPAWREPLLLLTGMLDKDDAVDLVSKVLNAHSRYERDLFRDLRLAAELLGERSDLSRKLKLVRHVISRLKKRLLKRNLPYLSHYYAYWWTKDKAGKSLGTIGMPAVPLLTQLLSRQYLSDRIYGSSEWARQHWPNAYAYLIDILSDEISPGDPSRFWPTGERRSRFSQVLIEIGTPIKGFLARSTRHDGLFAGFTRYGDDVLLQVRDALSAIGLPAIQDLEKALVSAPIPSRLRVIDTLGEIKQRQVVKVLQPLLQDPDSRVRYAAISAVQSSGNSLLAIEHLVPLLEDQDEDVRQEAALALGEAEDVRALPELIRRIEKPDSYKARCIRCLGVIGIPAIPDLTRLIEHGIDSQIYAEALGRIDDVSIIPGLLMAYSFNMTYEDGDTRKVIRKIIREAIGNFGTSATHVLLQSLQNQKEIMQRMEKRLRDMADQNESAYAFLSERAFWFMRSIIIMHLIESGDQSALSIIHQEKDLQAISWAIHLLHDGNNHHLLSSLIPTLLRILEEIPYYSYSAHLSGTSENAIITSRDQCYKTAELFIEVGTQSIPYLLEKMNYLGSRVAHIFESWNAWEDEKAELALAHQGIKARQVIIEILGKMGDNQAVLALIRLFGVVCQDVAYLLTEFDDGSSEPFQVYQERVKEIHQAITQSLGEEFVSHLDKFLYFNEKDKWDLSAQYYDTYQAIVQALGALGDHRATPVLCVELLGTNLNEYYQSTIAEALGKIGDPSAVAALRTALQTNIFFHSDGLYDYGLGKQCICALGEIGDAESVPDLIQILQDSKVQELRIAAAEALGKIGKSATEAVLALYEALSQASDEQDGNVLHAIIQALGATGNRGAVPILREALQHNISTELIIQALDAIGGPDAEVILREIAQNSRNLIVGGDAFEALVKTGDQQAIAVLENKINGWDSGGVAIAKKLKRVDVLLRTVGTDVFHITSDAIKEMGIDAYPGLMQALHQDPKLRPNPTIRAAAASLLSEMGTQGTDSEIFFALREQLNDAEPSVRLATALAVGKLGDIEDRRSAAGVLLRDWRTWKYPYFPGSDEVADIIGEFGEDEAAMHLLLWLGDREKVRESIVKVVGRIKDSAILEELIRKKNLFYQEMDLMETTANRLDFLQAPEISNPLLPAPPPSGQQRWLARFGLGTLWATLVVVAGGVLLLTDMLRNVFKEQWQVNLQTWARAHPVELLLLFGSVLLLGGLLTLGIDAIKDYIRKH